MQHKQQVFVDHILQALSLQKELISLEVLSSLYQQDYQIARTADLHAAILSIAKQVDHATLAQSYLQELEEQIDIILHKLKFIAPNDRPHVLLLDADNQYATFQTPYIRQAVEIAGGKLVQAISNEQEIDKLIILSDQPTVYSSLPGIINSPLLAPSKAIEKNQVYIITKTEFAAVEGVDYLIELEILAEIIQPKYFIYGHEGQDWLQFELLS